MDAERMLELFKIKPEITDNENAKPLKLTKGEIRFKDVTFAYNNRKPALSGINLKIDGGTTVAIVGETGSGKSTTLKLLQRFYDVTSGSIQIDGQDIRDVTVKRCVKTQFQFIKCSVRIMKLIVLVSGKIYRLYRKTPPSLVKPSWQTSDMRN
jgi:ABC-type transport system involved in Fe-S cluster assembly fused permease/ATPase subunit